MARNIVICSDGTGNSFRRHESNVARVVQHLALDDQLRLAAESVDREWIELRCPRF